MLNAVWIGLVVVAVVVGAINGRLEEVTTAAFASARGAVDVSIGLIGIMALWLGVMRVGEAAGLVRLLARAVRPLARRLFPDVPADHPALGAMVLNISASWLGLGNAATPFGLKAMEELQRLNPDAETASDAMVTFLAINTSAVTLVPATMIAVRASLGSANPVEIVAPTVAASVCATLAAVGAARLLRHFPPYRSAGSLAASAQDAAEEERP